MNPSLRHIIFFVYSFLISCGDRFYADRKEQPTSLADTSSQANIHNAFSAQNHLVVVKNFADTFQPDSLPYSGIGKLGRIPDSIVYAFKSLRHSDSLSHMRYLTVIFLKLYLDHLRCCHHSYEVRNNNAFGPIDSLADPLVYEYGLATGLYDARKPVEFINSGIGDTYVEKNKRLLEHGDIKELWSKMQPVKDSLDKGLYW